MRASTPDVKGKLSKIVMKTNICSNTILFSTGLRLAVAVACLSLMMIFALVLLGSARLQATVSQNVHSQLPEDHNSYGPMVVFRQKNTRGIIDK